ncbi:MAG: hypothetical protein V4714_19700 [Bacteroidota bacterium]
MMKPLFLPKSLVLSAWIAFSSQAQPTSHTNSQPNERTTVNTDMESADWLASNSTDASANNTRFKPTFSRYFLPDEAKILPISSNPSVECTEVEKLQINSFTINTSPATAYCLTPLLGTTFNLLFTATNGSSAGTPFTSGNVFTAQLSDASGSFGSPITIGTLTSTALSGTISATIPANTTTGTGYRIRVNASNPATVGNDNGSNIAIGLFMASPYVSQAFTTASAGSLVTALGASVTGYQWSYYRELGGTVTDLVGKTSQTYTPASADFAGAGTYYLICRMTTSNGCGTATSNEIIVYINCPQDASNPNLVVNGTFTSGTASFTSEYTYSTNLVPEGNYVVGNNPSTYHSSFCNLDTEAKRSPISGGNMLIANAATDGSKTVWKQTVAVTANKDYILSFYATSLAGGANSLLFGVYVGCFRTGVDVSVPYQVSNCTWNKYTFHLSSGSATSLDLAIRNISAVAAGNDIAIDDIQFYACQQVSSPPFPIANAFKWRGISADWLNKDNWGNACSLPTCSDNVSISLLGVGKVYPTISGNGGTAKSITIDNGATLTIQAGYNLDLCGDLINNGTFTSDASASITLLNNNTPQLMSGNLTGTNKLGNVVINKTNASDIVRLSNTVEMAGNLTITQGNLDANGNQIKIGGNFSNAGIFTPNSGTVEFNGTANQQFTQTGTGQFYNLTINNGTAANTLTLNPSTTTVTHQLVFANGRVVTGSNEISVTNAATSALSGYSANSYVNGYIRRAVSGANAYDFPVGDASRYELIAVNITSALAGTSDIKGYFNGTTPGGTVPSVSDGVYMYNRTCTAGYWTLTPDSQPSAGSFDLQITPVGVSCTGESQTLGKRSNSGGSWSTAGSTAVSSTRRNGYTSFSEVVQLGGDFSSLPVHVSSFSGEYTDGYVFLSWATVSEKENAYFLVERSRDGLHFESIGRMYGHGTTSLSHKYRFADNQPLPGVNYYQLRQVDTQGKFEDSKIIGVQIPFKGQVNWYPNAVSLGQAIHFQIEAKEAAAYQVRVTDLMGKLLLQGEFTVEPGEHELSLLGSERLTTGVYIINAYNLHSPALELYQGKLLVK